MYQYGYNLDLDVSVLLWEEHLPQILQAILTNLAERIEVLFEGLKQTSEQDLSQRLELTTKFLEFTLANIENRLQNLSK